jgi:hypothetical protein
MLLHTKARLRLCFERCNSRLPFSGKTALHTSCEWGDNVEVCKLLVKFQANVNAADPECDARHFHMLLKTKAGLRFCFKHCNSRLLFSGQTALHLSSTQNGHVEFCKFLVECQADVNAKDKKCDARPLHTLLKTKAGSRFCFERCNSLFFSVERLHCICLLVMVTWNFASCWSSVKLT